MVLCENGETDVYFICYQIIIRHWLHAKLLCIHCMLSLFHYHYVKSAPSYVCFPTSPEGFLQAFLPMTRYRNFCSACAVNVVIFGHIPFFLLT